MAPNWKPVPKPNEWSSEPIPTYVDPPVSTNSLTEANNAKVYGPLTDPDKPFGGRNGYTIPRPGEPEYGQGDHGR